MLGLKFIKTIRDFELSGKNVFLRLDLNVPLDGGKISDETRIRESLPTIKYALEKGAKLVIASHLGRPKSSEDKKYSMEPVGLRLSELLGVEVILLEDPASDAVRGMLKTLKSKQVLLLENLRFAPGETENDQELAQTWASFTDIYINDAFGASHRAHASIEALPALLQNKGIGLLIEKEILMLDKLIHEPKRPYVAILGGAKVSDKIAVIEKLLDVVDAFVIGGAMAYTFLKAQGHAVGKSLVEEDKVKFAREMIARIEVRNKTLLLPIDHVVASSIKDSEGNITNDANIPADKLGADIGPKTISAYAAAIKEAGTIFWNGPMGVFENAAFSKGTFAIAKMCAENPNLKIVGGGDSASAAHASGYAEKMTHISTGGGASLEYLQGDHLPGLEVLRVKRSEVI